MAVGYQSFYTAQLTSNITDTDLVIPLDVAPTPDEGFLVIESTVTAKREIIYYTSKTSNSVTCPSGAGNGRGYDGTTAVSHLSGSAVIMAPVGAMFSELREQFTTTPQGWTNLGIAQSGTITHNGNRSYTVPFASSVASTLSEGMRLQFTKTVAGNGYMGGLFNGSSHYFIKTSPTGTLGTVTNNFSIVGWVEPTAYQDGAIASRCDSAANNLLEMRMASTGQLRIQIASGGSANIRYVDTHRSLSLNKKQFCVMTWSSGTVTAYIDGESVTVATAVTGGTAPTTAGTGGDFAIGRRGASANLYYAGYASGVQVYDKVLSAAEVRALYSQKASGSETNCIGSWSLDNTANDQNAAANNLTATGGVGFTARSPHGQLGNGVETTKAVGLVMAVSGTDVTVQTPEGCTIPTTGGITSVAYSTQANPYGWVAATRRWELAMLLGSTISASGSTINTWYNPGGVNLSIPVGAWGLSAEVELFSNPTSTVFSSHVAISTSSSAMSDIDLTSMYYQTGLTAGAGSIWKSTTSKQISNASATPYYIIVVSGVALSAALALRSAPGAITSPEITKVVATPAGL